MKKKAFRDGFAGYGDGRAALKPGQVRRWSFSSKVMSRASRTTRVLRFCEDFHSGYDADKQFARRQGENSFFY
ncbi:MAG: hypothetical protein LBK44_02260 [Spirochaetales bacterium]|nr:hypothetical protein [Spirochaetales bacterium]